MAKKHDKKHGRKHDSHEHGKEDKKSDVFILRHGGEYVVRPAFVVIDGNRDTFKIRNMTGSANVLVTLDPALAPKGNEKRVGLGKTADFSLDLKREHTSFEFQVTVNGQSARGESDPVIIIDPPRRRESN